MTLPRKLAYSLGDFGLSVSYFAVGFFLMNYLTDHAHMEPLLAGIALTIGRIWDAVNDPFIGIWNDRIRSRFGRKRAFVLFGALPLAASFFLLWCVPQAASTAFQFGFAAVASVLFATAYSIVVVPYFALVPVLTKDYDERARITGYRAQFSAIGTIAGGLSALFVDPAATDSTGVYLMAGAFGLVVLLSLLAAAAAVRGMENESEGEREIMGVGVGVRDFFRLFRDKNLLALLFSKALGAVATGLLAAAFPYFAAHVVGNRGWSTYALGVFVLASAVAVPFWERFCRKEERRKVLLGASAGAFAVSLLMAFLLPHGRLLPFLVGAGGLGLFMGAVYFIPYSFMPDMTDYWQRKTGRRQDSVFFGIQQTAHQAGAALVPLTVGLVLQLVGYSVDASQAPASLAGIRILFGLLPGVFLVLSALVLFRYAVTRKEYEKIRRELDAAPAAIDGPSADGGKAVDGRADDSGRATP